MNVVPPEPQLASSRTPASANTPDTKNRFDRSAFERDMKNQIIVAAGKDRELTK
jgi:hypothetical protein